MGETRRIETMASVIRIPQKNVSYLAGPSMPTRSSVIMEEFLIEIHLKGAIV